MYAIKDYLFYACVLVPLITPNLIPIYKYTYFTIAIYSNFKGFLVSVNSALRIHVERKIDDGGPIWPKCPKYGKCENISCYHI